MGNLNSRERGRGGLTIICFTGNEGQHREKHVFLRVAQSCVKAANLNLYTSFVGLSQMLFILKGGYWLIDGWQCVYKDTDDDKRCILDVSIFNTNIVGAGRLIKP